ncbi:MAG: carbamoyltransferase HypF [Coriobacteriia bacterium]|nr:carbamoyltransferase HypF [Coriobacteriia bacterium]
MIAGARVSVTGVVQGVGFRPFVYNLARQRGLTGWVNNTAEGVTVVIEGDPAAVAAFPEEVRSLAPPMAVVESVSAESVEPSGFTDFSIRASEARGDLTLVSPDIATCPACREDLSDPGNRRFRYPFTNCTNCGPRFTIIDSLPYDRPGTSMKDFPMCAECAAEYGDPGDRRFHAQPNACHVCGPRLFLNVKGRAPSGWEWDRAQERVPRPHRDRAAEARRTDDIIEASATILAGGDILAIKGLGGFHLACDATNEVAVARLRDRKRRWGKPFAVMVADVEQARVFCHIGDEEGALLEGTARPIVLLRLREHGEHLAPSVAPGLAELGVMLAYTPLHHILLAAAGRPLVMTSGNLSDEPIAIDNDEALRRLAPIADGFLLHDRAILQRYDDSVVRVVACVTEPVRRSRGFAPFPIRLPFSTDRHILATGPEQKNTFCLAREGYAFVSQHIGDMENADTLESYERTIELYERMFRVRPEIVAYDLHPDYLSTKFAHSLGLAEIGVQHHHAHIASVTAEHGIAAPVVGLAFDGTGFGPDGTIWGGEVLLADWTGYERIAHLRQVPMPGGAAAIRRPARMALGLLMGMDRGLLDHPGSHFLHEALTTDELTMLPAMVDRGVNSPLTSSMGRLFDAVAAITGVRADAAYEGQAAIELEAIADPQESVAYRFAVIDGPPAVIDPEPVVRAILDDVSRGVPAPIISARFHNAVIGVSVDTAVAACGAAGAGYVACSGGVFMNRILMAGVLRGIENAGITPLTPRDLPVNDGGISFGQAAVAWSRRDTV